MDLEARMGGTVVLLHRSFKKETPDPFHKELFNVAGVEAKGKRRGKE